MRTARTITPRWMPSVLGALGLLLVGLVVGPPQSAAQSTERCARADARLAATGRGDRDHDGLSNCAEKHLWGTDHRDYDSDDDGVADGDEIEDGTDPTDPDTDNDGVDDGEEQNQGTDPTDADSDDDGIADGDDCNPSDEIKSEIQGAVQDLTCPTTEGEGTLKLLGIAITLSPTTKFENVASCAAVAVGANVEVKVTGDLSSELVAEKAEVKDANDDGCVDEPEDKDEPGDEP